MPWMTLGHDAMSNSGLQWIARGYVNNSRLWAPGSMTDRLERECDTQTPRHTSHGWPNDEGSAYGWKDFGSWMRKMTLDLELRVLNGKNDSRSWIRRTTLDPELRALTRKNDSRSKMKWETLGRELKALNGKNDFGSWMRRTTLGRELKTLNGKNDSGS